LWNNVQNLNNQSNNPVNPIPVGGFFIWVTLFAYFDHIFIYDLNPNILALAISSQASLYFPILIVNDSLLIMLSRE